jgi:hypothetical protein
LYYTSVQGSYTRPDEALGVRCRGSQRPPGRGLGRRLPVACAGVGPRRSVAAVARCRPRRQPRLGSLLLRLRSPIPRPPPPAQPAAPQRARAFASAAVARTRDPSPGLATGLDVRSVGNAPGRLRAAGPLPGSTTTRRRERPRPVAQADNSEAAPAPSRRRPRAVASAGNTPGLLSSRTTPPRPPPAAEAWFRVWCDVVGRMAWNTPLDVVCGGCYAVFRRTTGVLDG